MKCLNLTEAEEGTEGAWGALCDRKVSAAAGIVVELSTRYN